MHCRRDYPDACNGGNAKYGRLANTTEAASNSQLAGALMTKKHGSENPLSAMIEEDERRRRKAVRGFVRGVLLGDIAAIVENMKTVDPTEWASAMRAISRLNSVSPIARDMFLHMHKMDGDHIRQEVGDDVLLAKAYRIVFGKYDGPGMTLFRGESADNRRFRRYGISWTDSREVADAFARARCEYYRPGTVTLQAEVPAEGIVLSIGDSEGESEYLVDRRFLTAVRVISRYRTK